MKRKEIKQKIKHAHGSAAVERFKTALHPGLQGGLK